MRELSIPTLASSYRGGLMVRRCLASCIDFVVMFLLASAAAPLYVEEPVAVIGRPVVNTTNLTDTFDWELTWTDLLIGNGDALVGPDRDALAPDAVSIFTALEEQLGLKLEPARGPVNVLVIDGVEHPTEN